MVGGMTLSSTNSRGSFNSNDYRKHAVNYPWDEWFTLKHFRLVQGKHFYCTMGGMTVNVRQAARRHGLRVRIDQGWGELTITVKGDNE